VEVNLELLISHAPAAVQSVPFSSYPVAKEDVAFELDAAVAAGDVGRTIREAAGELLESVRVFDVYTGAPIPAGKKSLAFALRFRAPDRTLTEAETAEVRDRAVAAVVREFGAVHRA
jgi:phenylalanyl-tRNA synthetase beta chain